MKGRLSRLSAKLLAMALGIAAGAAGQLGAQEAGAVPGQADEGMLRYYASQYDYARVDAEIARLQRLHPGWQPPRDLFGAAPRATGPAVDVSGLWAAYEREDFETVRRDIAALEAVNPNWQPPPRLLELMADRELRQGLKAAEARADWAVVVELSRRHPGSIDPTPERIENLWIVARAHDELGAGDQAHALYRRVLEESADPDLRLSTLQKALAHHGEPGTSALFALEESLPRGTAQQRRFEQIVSDRAAASGGAGADRFGLALRRIGTGESDPGELAWVADTARERRDANAAMVLGWHAYRSSDWPAAERWFSDSLAWRESPKAVEGLARTYLQQGRHEQAERLAAAWVGRAPKLQAVVDDARLASAPRGGHRDPGEALRQANTRLTGSGEANPGLLVARGWALYDLNRTAEAAADFERALEAPAIASAAKVDAARGLALALTKRGMVADARALLDRHDLSAEESRELEQAMTAQAAVDAYAGGRYERSLALAQQYRQMVPDSEDLVAIEGWSLFQLERYGEAREVFAEMHASYGSADAKAGLRAVDSRHYWEDGTTRGLYRQSAR